MRPIAWTRVHIVLLGVTIVGGATAAPVAMAHAQSVVSVVINFHVTDSLRAPLSEADVAVIGNDTTVVGLGRTNSAGLVTLVFEPDNGLTSYKVNVRRVGYAPVTRRLNVTVGYTMRVELSLARIPSIALDTVRSEAQRLPIARRPYIDANEIERSTRGVFTLRDVISKLRWDIGYQTHICPTSRVDLDNDRPPDIYEAQTRIYADGIWIPNEPEYGWDPLNTIMSEHIAEIQFVNCLDESIPGVPRRSWPSLYITLKAGVKWDIKHGSYVRDSATYLAGERERKRALAPPASPPSF